MKHLLWLLVVFGVAGGAQWYYPRTYGPQVKNAEAATATALKERDDAAAALTQTQLKIDDLTRKLVGVQAELKQSQSQAEAEAMAQRQLLAAKKTIEETAEAAAAKQKSRDEAKGEKLDELVTAKGTFHHVTIQTVDAAGINITHENGGATVSFEDLAQNWRDRFQYDKAEADQYLKDVAKAQSEIGDQVQRDLVVYEQNEAKAKAKVAAEFKAEIQARNDSYKDQIDSWRQSLRNILGLVPTQITTFSNGHEVSQTVYPPHFADPEDDPKIGEPSPAMYPARSLRDQINQLKPTLQ